MYLVNMVRYRGEVEVMVTVSFQKVPYRTISLLKGTLNDTNLSEVIIY